MQKTHVHTLRQTSVDLSLSYLKAEEKNRKMTDQHSLKNISFYTCKDTGDVISERPFSLIRTRNRVLSSRANWLTWTGMNHLLEVGHSFALRPLLKKMQERHQLRTYVRALSSPLWLGTKNSHCHRRQTILDLNESIVKINVKSYIQ